MSSGSNSLFTKLQRFVTVCNGLASSLLRHCHSLAAPSEASCGAPAPLYGTPVRLCSHLGAWRHPTTPLAHACAASREQSGRAAPRWFKLPQAMPRRGPRPLGSRGPKYGVALSWMHERVRIMKAVLRASRAESSGAHFAFSMGPTGGCLLCINCVLAILQYP